MKILFISPKIQSVTGGEVIRKRNYEFLKEYVDEKNLYLFEMPYYALYKEFEKTDEIKKQNEEIFNNLLKALVLFKPDYLYLDNSLIFLPKEILTSYKTIVFYHNIETNYIRQEAKVKEVDESLINAVYENEKKLSELAYLRICINKRDSDELKRLYNKEADYILPISFKDTYQKQEINNDQYMLFVGSDFFGNTEGLFWFVDNCLKEIPMKLLVVGKGMDRYENKYTFNNLEFLGTVDDLSTYYQNATLVIEPIISGSGMKTKTAEALMYGKKIFGTKEAFEGYTNIEEADVSLCDKKEEFIKEINTYININSSKYLEAARNYFLKYYDNEVVKKEYFNFLDKEVKK